MALLSAAIKAILDGSSTPNNGQFRTTMGTLYDFVTDLLGLDSSDKAGARAALGAASSGTNTDITALSKLKSTAGVAPGSLLNRIINGNFAFNQRVKTGSVVLTAGQYGHDRWKAGSAGCAYTFATVGEDTTITITAGSLMQVVHPKRVIASVYTLSSAGTAQARIGINGAAPAGAYGATPLTTSAANAGQSITVEFNAGTVGLVQLDPLDFVRAYEQVDKELAFMQCKAYYRKSYVLASAPGTTTSLGALIRMGWTNFLLAVGDVTFGGNEMQAVPTISIYSTANGAAGYAAEFNTSTTFLGNIAVSVSGQCQKGFSLLLSGGGTSGNQYYCQWTAEAEL